jgi:hypothetical protein
MRSEVACAIAGCRDTGIANRVRDMLVDLQWAILSSQEIGDDAKLELVSMISERGFKLADDISGEIR